MTSEKAATEASARVAERLARGRALIEAEIAGMRALAEGLDDGVSAAVDLILGMKGRLVVTGIGKSGHIGGKLAATFASTGTRAFFVHAAEAAHGDLGMISPGDVVLAISNSGTSPELAPILDYCAEIEVPIVALCARDDSRLGRGAAVLARLPEVEEAGAGAVAPTTSAVVSLAMGHVIAGLLMEARSFEERDFAIYHPGGKLGRRLSTIARYLDTFGSEAPSVRPEAPAAEVINRLTEGRMGCVVVVAADGALAGLVTEGDLRRAYSPELFERTAAELMTREPMSMRPDKLVSEAVAVMTEKRIANMIVAEEGKVLAVLHVKDLLQRGYV